MAGALGVAMAGCGSSSTPATSSTTAATATTLTEEANVGATFVDNFNPYNPASMSGIMNMGSLFYEPLFEFNALNATEAPMPWLATAYSWNTAGTQLNITVRSGIKNSDGTAFGAADVQANFDAVYTNSAANAFGIPKQSAAPTVAGNVVTLSFASAEFTNEYSILGNQLMIPASEISSVGVSSLATGTIANPVGPGPFMLAANGYSSSEVKTVANPNFWNGKPKVPGVDIPSYASNGAALTALENNTLDWAGNDLPNVYEDYVGKDSATNHAYFAPGNTVTLWFNTTYGQLGDAAVRAAISQGIDRTALSEEGETGYENPATSDSGLILPAQNGYLVSNLADDLKAGSNATAMDTLLTGAGWTAPLNWNSTSSSAVEPLCTASAPVADCWNKGGQIISFNIEDPAGYTDYAADALLISSQLQGEGINATPDLDANANTWYSDYQAGNFQTMIHWGNGGPFPFVQYDNWLDDTQPLSAGDYGSFKSTAAQTALTTLEGTNPTDTSAITSAVQSLETIMATQVPEAPLLYGADWNVYSTAHYTGWPSSSNPYINPAPNNPELPYILDHLTPVS